MLAPNNYELRNVEQEPADNFLRIAPEIVDRNKRGRCCIHQLGSKPAQFVSCLLHLEIASGDLH